MSKDTYTFSEVLFGLREEYLKNQELLDELENYISITGDKFDSYGFSLGESLRGYNIIRLDIVKKQSEIKEIIDHISFEVFNRATYCEPFQMVKNGENGQYFGPDDYTCFTPETHYNVEITDPKAFKELTDEINNTRLMKQKGSHIDINSFQTLDIDLHRLTLWTSGEVINSNAFGVIAYDPIKDVIDACPNMKKGYHFTLDMLDTRVPAYMIPEGYREIIDDNLKKYNFNVAQNIQLASDVNRREELAIDEDDDKIVLTKIRKLKFYE